MSETKQYYWLKLQKDFFQSKRIKKLRRLAGGDTYTIIYLKMQLLSITNNGILEYIGLEQSFEEELALDIDEDVENVKIVFQYLLGCGLLENIDNVHFELPYAQQNIGKESASAKRGRDYRNNMTESQIEAERERARIGMREVRAKRKSEKKDECYECYERVTNVEKEKEIEIEKEYINNNIIPSVTDNVTENVTDKNLDFDIEDAFNKVFELYPKKTSAVIGKTKFIDRFFDAIDYKERAKLIWFATKMFVENHKEQYPDDTNFKYLPKFCDFLDNDCDYWISEYEKTQGVGK